MLIRFFNIKIERAEIMVDDTCVSTIIQRPWREYDRCFSTILDRKSRYFKMVGKRFMSRRK